MDFKTTAVVLLSILQVTGAIPLVLISGEDYNENPAETGPVNNVPKALADSEHDLIEMKKTLASLEALVRREQEIKEAEEDIFSKISQANKGSKMQIYQGDVVMTPGRSATKCEKCLWTKSSSGKVSVPYTLSSSYDDRDKARISTALKELMTLSCIEFVHHTTEKDYLKINSGDGCWSYIGKTGGGQIVSLAKNGCMSHGIIQHEVLHALGFIHEQTRSDRDQHVDIMYQYINKGDVGNFDKADSNNLGLQYDYSSVMHYGRYYASNTSKQATIIPKPDASVSIGQRYGVSSLDVSKLNKLYNCNLCRSVLTGTSGILTSGNYPSAYPNESSCVWLIRIQSDKVFLQFNAFDVQSSKHCASDYIKVYDGASTTSPMLLDKACGTGQLPPLVASGNAMLVEFVSDRAGTGTGFKASYSTVTCGGTFSSDNGVVTSPGYPEKYPNSVDCIFPILAPVGYKIKMTFTNFRLELVSSCSVSSDHLAVYDGSSITAPKLGTFCSQTQIPPPVTSTGNSMLLQFHSDVWMNSEGFRAKYSFVKG
ncbi:embryonic protein UVS.2-like [Ascaphus truei]|uniref:embryonic protein UVS.2-like n=1 Tax=Ascaphus truei TaxID=8439 RepID=UPI003F599A40